MVKDFKVKAGGQVLIETDAIVVEAERQPLANHQLRAATGIIKTPRRNDYPARRARAGGINFYDLGQIKNDAGEFVESDLVILAPNSQPNVDAFRAAIDGKRNALFSVDRAKWKSVYKKIAYETAERYRFDLRINEKPEPIGRNGSRNDLFTNQAIADSHWTAEGLKFKEAIRSINLSSLFFFENFDTSDSSIKITNAPDVSAERADFTIEPKANVYLVPTIGFFTARGMPELLSDSANDAVQQRGYVAAGQVCNGSGESSAIPMYEKTHAFQEITRVSVLNYFYTSVPRKSFLDDARWQATANGISFNESAESDNLKIIDGWRQHAAARASLETTTVSGTSYTYAVNQTSAYYYTDTFWRNSYFPRAVCETRSNSSTNTQQTAESADSPMNFTTGNGNFDNVYGFNTADTDRLLAVIESGGKWFYIWQKHATHGGD